jgi:hypothetical protein
MRAFIECIGCRNNGMINGKWVSLERIEEETDYISDSETTPPGNSIYGGIATMEPYPNGGRLAPHCTRCFGDEFEVSDSEGIPAASSINIRDLYENAELLRSLEEDDVACERIAAVCSNFHYTVSSLEEAMAYDDDHYRGWYSSLSDFAISFLEETASENLRGETLLGRPLLDWLDGEEVWRYSLQHDHWYADTGLGVHVWAN